ncbi:hypothetical protein BB559_007509 [Furculomyces boomerangus]|uniref:Sec1-like protein n=2 Tax=Harpellales TaxID=61421 RepID=A0A2T9XX12_9FUNG|nr:hypothetical protein BB559_007509 [Furculomyces boomerangus]PWA00811.1 hypothetical protein BB558_003117 [Smittium angustum]
MLNLHSGKSKNNTTNGFNSPSSLRSNYEPKNNEDEDELIWKALIFDSFCRDIVSTVLKVSDLRENGVTVHMMLDSPRSKISDAPAIYFVQPTSENIQKITDDMINDLYDLYYLNFSSSIPRNLVEELAVSTVASKTSHQISQVYDKYINYICPEENMFSLGIKDAYKLTHDPTITDNEIQKLVEQIVSSLFSVLVTLKTIPLIAAAKGGAAEMIAARLNQKIRDHTLHSKSNLLADINGEGWLGGTTMTNPNGRPVLLLLDRDFDLSTMLAHSWTYQSLIHDVLDMNLNQITIETEIDGNMKKKSYDVDIRDDFWAQMASKPFPEAAIGIDEASTSFKKEADEITRVGGVGSLDDMQELDFGASTKQLQKAINMLPELTARKATIDMHMNVATAVLQKIKDRQLDVLYQIEESISKQTKQSILDTIRSKERGTPTDKMRVFIMYLLSKQTRSQSGGDVSGDNMLRADDASNIGLGGKRGINLVEGMEEFEQALQEAGCNMDPLFYVKKLQSLTRMTIGAASSSPGTVSTDFLGKFTSIGSKLTGLGDGSGLGNLLAGVKSFLPSNKDLPVSQLVKVIMEGSSQSSSSPSIAGGAFSSSFGSGGTRSNNVDNSTLGVSNGVLQSLGVSSGINVFDPIQIRQSTYSSALRSGGAGSHTGGFQNAIVFVVGGASYLEYMNLQDFSNRSQQKRNIIYGSTDIVNPESFIKQLGDLNKAQI